MHSLWTVKHFSEKITNPERLCTISNFETRLLNKSSLLFTAQWKYKSYSNIEIHKTQIMALELMLEVMQARLDIKYI